MKAVTMDNKSNGPPWKVHCPACNRAHMFTDGWAFNLDFDFPTFVPNMRVQIPYETGGVYTCHSKVKNGCITYMEDSSHQFKGMTLQLPEIS